MKREGHLFEKITDLGNIRIAEKRARRGKHGQYGVKKHLENAEGNILDVKCILENKSFTTSKYKVFTIFEGKERLISQLPFFPDRLVHHTVMNVLEPIFVKMFTADTYSCIKGRGVHKASYKLREYLRDEESTKYCLKIDIRKFYQSIDHNILKKLLRRKFKDKNLLWLLDDIVESTEGIPLGNYTSQHLSNYYMTYFDHWVKEVLGVKMYLRYADDMVFLSNDKNDLRAWLDAVKKYLWENLRLEVKSNHQIFPVKDRGIDWVGYVHYHTHTLLRKSIKKKYIANRIKMNHNGWLVHCNSINLRRKYEQDKNL